MKIAYRFGLKGHGCFPETLNFDEVLRNGPKLLYYNRVKAEMTREEIEKQMDELARKYVETHDHKIIEELYRLSLEFETIEKRAKSQGDSGTNVGKKRFSTS